jgi:hypothetical protein
MPYVAAVAVRPLEEPPIHDDSAAYPRRDYHAKHAVSASPRTEEGFTERKRVCVVIQYGRQAKRLLKPGA